MWLDSSEVLLGMQLLGDEEMILLRQMDCSEECLFLVLGGKLKYWLSSRSAELVPGWDVGLSPGTVQHRRRAAVPST